MTRGSYQLILDLSEPTTLRVGRRGTFLFPAGRYIYTGSALNGVERRLARHRRQDKTLHWHIDYLLCYARIARIRVFPTSEKVECALNQKALKKPGAQVIVEGFGSSDCRCPSHLVFLGPLRT